MADHVAKRIGWESLSPGSEPMHRLCAAVRPDDPSGPYTQFLDQTPLGANQVRQALDAVEEVRRTVIDRHGVPGSSSCEGERRPGGEPCAECGVYGQLEHCLFRQKSCPMFPQASPPVGRADSPVGSAEIPTGDDSDDAEPGRCAPPDETRPRPDETHPTPEELERLREDETVRLVTTTLAGQPPEALSAAVGTRHPEPSQRRRVLDRIRLSRAPEVPELVLAGATHAAPAGGPAPVTGGAQTGG